MLKRILSVFLFFCGVFTIYAQQSPLQSLSFWNEQAYNPAFAGIEGNIEFNGLIRQQWNGLEAAPSTQALNFSMPLYYLNSGIGFSAAQYEMGIFRDLDLKISYAYHLDLGDGKLGIGFALGGKQKTLSGNTILTPDGEYEGGSINHNDDLLPSEKQTAQAFSVDLGLFYLLEDWRVGAGVDNVFAPNIEFFGSQPLTISVEKNYFFTFARLFYLNRQLNITPSVMFRTDMIEAQADFSAVIDYNNTYFLGLGLRGYNKVTLDAVSVIVGFQVNEKLKIAYAYDAGISSLKNVHQGSNEILLKYAFPTSIGKGKPAKIIYNPRAL